jgi:hypothetical protein
MNYTLNGEKAWLTLPLPMQVKEKNASQQEHVAVIVLR